MAEAATATTDTATGTTEPSETGGDGAPVTTSLRDKLIESLQENRAKREAVAKPEAKNEKPPKDAKPKADAKPSDKGKLAGKHPEASTDAEEKPDDVEETKPDGEDDDYHDPVTKKIRDIEKMTPAKLKRYRREFSKYTRKKARQLDARESEVHTLHSQNTELRSRLEAAEASLKEGIQSERAAFKSDPLAWLRKQGEDVRKVLLDYANQEAEDPRDAKLRELEQKNADRDKREREREEREAKAREDAERERSTEEQRRLAAQARAELTANALAELKRNGDSYPLTTAQLDPEHTADFVMRNIVEHYRSTMRVDASGRQIPGSGQELDPEDVLRQIESNLREMSRKGSQPDRAKLEGGNGNAEAATSEPPDRARTVSEGKAVNPAARQSRRADDVSSRTRSIGQVGHSDFDRDSVRDTLIASAKARGMIR
jgi:hypothetical protein